MKNTVLSVSICVPAYNEEQNIANILNGLLQQKTEKIHIKNIAVVSSGSTDNTNAIVQKFARNNQTVHFIHEEKRTGKAAAINAFLRQCTDPVVVIQSADTVPLENTIENLCKPFLEDKKIGMTGGAPIPLNDKNTFLGYIIHAWWWFHRNIPRFGEIIAFRNVLSKIAADTAVDEAYIQALLIKSGFKVVHIDSAVVRNRGADTIKDLIKQRRRIYNGHSRLYEKEKVRIDNMTKSSLNLLLFKYKIKNVKELLWLLGGITLEMYARALGSYDMYISRINPFRWDIARSTKRLRTFRKGETFT